MGDNAIDPVKGSGDYCNLARDRVRGKIMEYLPDEGAVEGWLSHRGGLLRDGWDVQGLQCGAGSPRDLQLAGTRLEGNALLRWESFEFRSATTRLLFATERVATKAVTAATEIIPTPPQLDSHHVMMPTKFWRS